MPQCDKTTVIYSCGLFKINVIMKILVACEESQAVTIELRKLGHEAYSCDIEECSGGHPEWHLREDVLPLLEKEWDMIIAFPPSPLPRDSREHLHTRSNHNIF